MLHVCFLYHPGTYKFEREFYCFLESAGTVSVNIVRSGDGTAESTLGKSIDKVYAEQRTFQDEIYIKHDLYVIPFL